jgi:hypothetical protein
LGTRGTRPSEGELISFMQEVVIDGTLIKFFIVS